jgi:large subunit ribosomal protein L14
MIQKGTYLMPIDKCGVWWVNVFHIYKGFNKKIGKIGDFVKVSVRNTRPNNWVLKKTKLNAIIILTKKAIRFSDGSFIKFRNNNAVLLKKRLTAKGKEIVGPGLKLIKRKKFLMSFSGIL